MKAHKIQIGIILATFILISCTACNKENKTVPTMATVSSLSSDVGVSSLADSVTSSAVSSTASSSTSSTVSKASSSSSSTASKSTGGTTTVKPSSGSTAKPSGGNTTKPSGGGSTGGSNTKPSGGGSTTGGGTTTTTQPAQTGVNARYYGAKYGCDSQNQYDYVIGKASTITSSSKYQNTYSYNASDKDAFKQFYGVDYSDEMNKVVSIGGCFSGNGSASSGSAYSYFTGANRSCADRANALEASLHVNGINSRLAWGTLNGENHMWAQAYINGIWYNLDGTISTGSDGGHSIWGTGYNYG